jgi:hypothetical protein
MVHGAVHDNMKLLERGEAGVSAGKGKVEIS